MDLFKGILNHIEKDLGLLPKIDTRYTTNYSYLNNIPKPCNYINVKTGECCKPDTYKNNKDCVECDESMRKAGICNYVWDRDFNKDIISVKSTSDKDKRIYNKK